MSLENAKSILSTSLRVIGLKDTDMKKLSEQYESTKVSSFTADAAVVDPVIESVLEGQSEIVASEVVPEQISQTDNLTESNMFNGIMPESVSNVSSNIINPVIATVNEPSLEPIMPTVNSASMPVMNKEVQIPSQAIDEVQGGQSMFDSSNLDTPQTFFNRVEQNLSDNHFVNQPINNNYVTKDSAMILVDDLVKNVGNVKQVLEDKCSMINALSEKVSLLENQLRISEEARRVAEAQRDAAHATLTQARQAETVSTAGPTLTYQQQQY